VPRTENALLARKQDQMIFCDFATASPRVTGVFPATFFFDTFVVPEALSSDGSSGVSYTVRTSFRLLTFGETFAMALLHRLIKVTFTWLDVAPRTSSSQ
jgi:hypothetical protein